MLVFRLTQGNLLKKLVVTLEHIAPLGTLRYEPAGFSLQTTEAFPCVIAVGRLNSECFDYFHCHGDLVAGVSIDALSTVLADNDDDTITLHIPNTGTIHFYLEDNTGVYLLRHSETYIIDIPHNHRNIDESRYEYQVIVGIPTAKFREIYMSLMDSGDTVCILINDEEVEFNAGDVQFSLLKERNECIIGGAEEDDYPFIVFRLYHMYSFLVASELSDTVWLLWSRNSPALLTCHVTNCLFGYIKFYFF